MSDMTYLAMNTVKDILKLITKNKARLWAPSKQRIIRVVFIEWQEKRMARTKQIPSDKRLPNMRNHTQYLSVKTTCEIFSY
jgi:hypothetical protein